MITSILIFLVSLISGIIAIVILRRPSDEKKSSRSLEKLGERIGRDVIKEIYGKDTSDTMRVKECENLLEVYSEIAHITERKIEDYRVIHSLQKLKSGKIKLLTLLRTRDIEKDEKEA